jgi:hypothetical protein
MSETTDLPKHETSDVIAELRQLKWQIGQMDPDRNDPNHIREAIKRLDAEIDGMIARLSKK